MAVALKEKGPSRRGLLATRWSALLARARQIFGHSSRSRRAAEATHLSGYVGRRQCGDAICLRRRERNGLTRRAAKIVSGRQSHGNHAIGACGNAPNVSRRG